MSSYGIHDQRTLRCDLPQQKSMEMIFVKRTPRTSTKLTKLPSFEIELKHNTTTSRNKNKMRSMKIRTPRFTRSTSSSKSHAHGQSVLEQNVYTTMITQTKIIEQSKIQARFFGFDIPSTLMHYKKGQTIELDDISIETINEALNDVNYHLNKITEELESYDHHAHFMLNFRSSVATQLAHSAVLMNMGLQQKAKAAKEALEKLKEQKMKSRLMRNHQVIEECKTVLEPYFENNKFNFDFRPPYEFINTA